MDATRRVAIERFIASITGLSRKITSDYRCSGGCISQAQIVTLSDDMEYFVKTSANHPTMFASEAESLETIGRLQHIRVPQVIGTGQLSTGETCLVLEKIDSGTAIENYWPLFGEKLALIHQQAISDQYGWHENNYLGATVQPNDFCDDWIGFFAQHRLGFQIQLAKQRAVGSPELYRSVERLIERLDQWIDEPTDPPSLLHGDLWFGNCMVSADGLPVLIDPASYYGRREAELAMCYLFGGFPASFFDAYAATWPLEAGWRDRIEIYKLYHLLNHLNLFGDGYLDGCLKISRRFGA